MTKSSIQKISQITITYTVEPQWLIQAGTIKISSSQRYFQPSRVSFNINLNSRVPSSIYETSAVRVSVLLFSFSIFSDWQSLKIENQNNSMKT